MMFKESKIKNIILDLGGVLIGIDYQLTSKAFKKLGAENFDQVYTQYAQSQLFDLFETGKISSNIFRSKLQKALNIFVSEQVFDQAWNAMILAFPTNIISTLESLSDKYRLFLFSNTNEIHLKTVDQVASRQHLSHWKQFFEKTYFSHQFGYRKPHSESFKKLLENNHLLPQETLFIDDSIQHINGAKEANIWTYHYLKNIPGEFDQIKLVD